MLNLPKNVSVLEELERLGIPYEAAGENKVKCRCVFHDDENPSCTFTLDTAQFKCFAASCGESGSILKFIAMALSLNGERVPLASIAAELAVRYGDSSERPLDVKPIEKAHSALMEGGALKGELYKRGITDELIRKYRLGENNGRIWIPIKSEHGLYVNVRKYLPGATNANKMTNMKGRGRARLYPFEQIKYPELVICGGEIKAIAAASILNQHQIGAVCVTAGEGAWLPDFNRLIQDKTIYICMDIDAAGKVATKRLGNIFSKSIKDVRIVNLPLDAELYPKGDVNDYVVTDNADLLSVVRSSPKFEPEIHGLEFDDNLSEVEFSHLGDAKHVGKAVSFVASVTAVDKASYSLPKTLEVECSKNQPYCFTCPVFFESPTYTTTLEDVAKNGQPKQHNPTFAVRPDHPNNIELIGGKVRSALPVLKDLIGIPAQCKVCDVKSTEHITAEVVNLSPRLEISENDKGKSSYLGACIGCEVELNATYEFKGRIWPHPSDHSTSLILTGAVPVQDALDTCTIDNLDSLTIFQPTEWTVESIEAKLKDIYDDFSANVTNILYRQDVHFVIDLAYHSVLLLPLNGNNRYQRGWVETLVLGDSAQGKSGVVEALIPHYTVGALVECKNATRSGLIGGAQKGHGERWFISWGIIPTNDRRLVVLEEMKGLSVETIGSLTSMRSTGIAELPMIERKRTFARTRLACLSNPRGERPMSSHSFGVQALKNLIGSLEDIRRFDCVLAIRSQDVPEGLATGKVAGMERPHVYTSELCRDLILYAWTRKPSQIIISDNAKEQILIAAQDLCERYREEIPIVDKGSMRYKLARLGCALAARTFSVDPEEPEILIVRGAHIEVIHKFLRRIYDSDALGYYAFSEAIRITQDMKGEREIIERIQGTPYPMDLVENLISHDTVELIDLRDWCGYDRESAEILLSFLVRNRALYREGRNYRKAAAFITCLHRSRENGLFVNPPEQKGERF